MASEENNLSKSSTDDIILALKINQVACMHVYPTRASRASSQGCLQTRSVYDYANVRIKKTVLNVLLIAKYNTKKLTLQLHCLSGILYIATAVCINSVTISYACLLGPVEIKQ